ncbi:DUF502 domain-containing protein [Pseudotabrizicola sp. 4114]|uniref:DUF502 domain-containing protein n=1 Tax=Pseudotabrizicola sp. 4114 TaxID=2817731 RepID=UPI0028611AC5|nr:putative membrane protein [Pseudorhodobacter sp. 4114]
MIEPTPHPKRKGLFSGLRSSFLTGLVVVLPIGLTIYLIWTVVGWIDGWILPLIPGPWKPDALVRQVFGPEATIPVRGVGVVVFLIFTIFVGWLGKGFIGRKFLTWAEGLVDRMPVVRSIYNGLKQIAETVFSQNESSFERACLVQYPKEHIWAIGFVSTRAKGELQAKLNHEGYLDVISVFLPTTPNPTSGFLLYVPEKDVVYLDMKVEDAAKLIISAGLVYPNGKDAAGVLVQNPSAK